MIMKPLIVIFVLVFINLYSVIGQSTAGSNVYNYAIQNPERSWILSLIDSLSYQSNLCDDCDSPPTIKQYSDEHDQIFFRLRYACDRNSTFIRIYNESGKQVGSCSISDQIDDCTDFEAYSSFTFSDDILDIWSCQKGFNCDAKEALGLFKQYQILVDGSKCESRARTLSVSTEFDQYAWYDSEAMTSRKSSFLAQRSDTYTLAVTDQDGCVQAQSTHVQVFTEKEVQINGRSTLCKDDVIILSTNDFSEYQWSTGDTTPVISIDQPGLIQLAVKDHEGCVHTNEIQISSVADRSVEVSLGKQNFYRDEVVPIKLELFGFEWDHIDQISWYSDGSLTCQDCPAPFGKFSEESELSVSVTDSHGCLYEQYLNVKPDLIYKDIYAANIFMPESDDNNLFMLRSMSGAVTIHSFKVFTRWGVPVHEVGRHDINDFSMAWMGNDRSGAPLPPDVYVYMSEVEFIDGSKKTIRGDILLVR